MAVKLSWRSVQSTGSFQMHNTLNIYKDFSVTTPLPSAAALLIIAVRQVDFHMKNFVSLNGQVDGLEDMSFDVAKEQSYFVTPIFQNTSDNYGWQIHRISPGLLRDGTNHLGIHARDSEGRAAIDVDDFWVSRIFVVYTQIVD
jgi:hypothetical protein